MVALLVVVAVLLLLVLLRPTPARGKLWLSALCGVLMVASALLNTINAFLSSPDGALSEAVVWIAIAMTLLSSVASALGAVRAVATMKWSGSTTKANKSSNDEGSSLHRRRCTPLLLVEDDDYGGGPTTVVLPHDDDHLHAEEMDSKPIDGSADKEEMAIITPAAAQELLLILGLAKLTPFPKSTPTAGPSTAC